MGQPHCRTCPFVDTRNPDSQQYRAASQEGLCRAEPHDWRKVRLDYDWCGRHPQINLEGLHDRMIRGGPYSTLEKLALSAQRLAHMLDCHGPAEDDVWDVGIVLKSGYAKNWVEEWGYLEALVSKLEAEDPATPESDGA